MLSVCVYVAKFCAWTAVSLLLVIPAVLLDFPFFGRTLVGELVVNIKPGCAVTLKARLYLVMD